jgi:branched-chain amino acid transport system ATP-binding protein
MLELANVHAYYGSSHVLHGVSMRIAAAEAVSLLGRNGAGKSTTLATIMGYLEPSPGSIHYRGRDISGLAPFRIARLGVGFVPQERGVFSSLTVLENLTISARRGSDGAWDLQKIYRTFPRLKERAGNRGSQLSGGEQQMLSIARALMMNPSLLILDEPSEGLAPMLVQEIVHILRLLKQEGLSILLVEQNLHAALAIADRHYVLAKGQICFAGSAQELEEDETVIKAYLTV